MHISRQTPSDSQTPTEIKLMTENWSKDFDLKHCLAKINKHLSNILTCIINNHNIQNIIHK